MNLVILLFNELEAEGLVPADGEDIEGDLASNGVLEIQVGELFLKFGNEGLANVRRLVELFKLITLGL